MALMIPTTVPSRLNTKSLWTFRSSKSSMTLRTGVSGATEKITGNMMSRTELRSTFHNLQAGMETGRRTLSQIVSRIELGASRQKFNHLPAVCHDVRLTQDADRLTVIVDYGYGAQASVGKQGRGFFHSCIG